MVGRALEPLDPSIEKYGIRSKSEVRTLITSCRSRCRRSGSRALSSSPRTISTPSSRPWQASSSYDPAFGAGYRSPGSFTTYVKGLVDRANAWHCREPDCFAVDDFARSAASLHFYPSMVLIEKRPMEAP
jgi:hypothetical protein